MSQSDFGTIDPATKSGTQLATDLNDWRTALHSGHKGSTRPSYAIAGTEWINDSTNPWVVYMYDGTDDIAIGTINTTTNVFTPSGISAGVSGGTATAFTYTPAIPSTGNLENQEYDIEFHTAAGTTPTLSVSGQTALAIKYRDATGALQAINSSTTPSGWRSRVVNDGTYWVQREVSSVAASGAIGSSGLTMNTNKLLGRTTASAGAVEEIGVSSGLTFSEQTLAVDIASQADQEAGSDTTKVVTAGRQQFHPSAAKGWVKADTAGGYASAYNVASITDLGSGSLTVVWDVDFSSASYCVLVTAVFDPTGASGGVRFAQAYNSNYLAGSVTVWCGDGAFGGVDPNYTNVVAFGDQ